MVACAASGKREAAGPVPQGDFEAAAGLVVKLQLRVSVGPPGGRQKLRVLEATKSAQDQAVVDSATKSLTRPLSVLDQSLEGREHLIDDQRLFLLMDS